MKKRHLLFLSIFLTTFSFGQTVTIDPGTTYQTITGLGAMIPTDDEIYDLGVSMSRQDWSPEYNPGLGPANVNTEPGTWTFTHTASNITQLKKAQAIDPNFVAIATIWSPPYWLKRYDAHLYNVGDSSKRDAGGYLDTTKYDKFGEWVAQATQAFKAQYGFDLYAVSPQNEPEFAESYGSCVYTAPELRDATRNIGQKFAAHSITTTKIYHGEILPSQGHVIEFFQAVNDDAETEAYVGAFAIHNYDMDGIHPGGAGASNWASYYIESQRTTHKKQLWMTETSMFPTDINGGMDMAVKIYNAMAYGNINLWSHFYLGKGYGMTDHIYYVHKQFIRFIRPGAVRQKTTSSDSKVFALAFKNTAQSSYTIILINTDSTTKKTVAVNLPSSPGNFNMFRTSENEYCDYVGQTNLTAVSLPKFSVMTLVNVGTNKLPTINQPIGQIGDTIVWIKNTSNPITLSGISDGGEGNQTLKITTEIRLTPLQGGLFSTATVSYTAGSNTGTLNVTLATNKTGKDWLKVIVDDQSTACNGFYSKKEIRVPFIVIPFINKAPTFDDFPDLNYKPIDINQQKTLFMHNVTDGNDGSQSKTLSVSSSNNAVASATAVGNAMFNLTPKGLGTSIISVTIKDNGDTYMGGVNTTTKTFKVTVGNVGIDEEEILSDIYPNPAKETIIITNPYKRCQAAVIVDMAGREVENVMLTDLYNTVNIKSLQPGIYLVKLISGQKVIVKKFIKE
jgi:O-glycosyl hydrolase